MKLTWVAVVVTSRARRSTDEHAAAQMRCIRLSEDQAGAILRMRELYLHNLGALMRRRQELSALLKVHA